MTTETLPPLAFGTWMRHDKVQHYLDMASPSTVLEVGIGDGSYGCRLSSMVPTYVGVEPDDTSRAIAAERLGQERVMADLSELGDRTFDLLCAFEVVEHIEDDQQALSEWLEYVRPGGHVMLSVPAFEDRFASFDKLAGHFRRYDPDHMRSLLESVGIDVLDVSINGAPIGFVGEMVKNRIADRKSREPQSQHELTMASGRVLKPTGSGRAIEYASKPFRLLQKAFPETGVGLLAFGQKPKDTTNAGSA